MGLARRAMAEDSLVTQNLRLVTPIAYRISRAVPRPIELNDLISHGMLGLVKGAASYDPDRGPLRPWLRHQIRFAIYDYVRAEFPYAAGRRRLVGDVRAPATEARGRGAGTRMLAALEQALSTLSRRERQLIDLVYRDNLSFRAIGRRHLLNPFGPVPLDRRRWRGAPRSTGGPGTVARELARTLTKLRVVMAAAIAAEEARRAA